MLHSRLSEGERADQIEMAKNGDIDIMIGPRSALFTPFERLGIIIMDEEHETSYISESSPGITPMKWRYTGQNWQGQVWFSAQRRLR